MSTFKNYKFLALVIILFTFLLQPIKTGFETGHHGWVSADGLSLISRANTEHHFVGVMAEVIDADGKLQHHYFDRYPLFFSTTMNLLLKPFEWDFAKYIMGGRYIMNIIYLFTILIGFKLLLHFFDDKLKAISAALLVFSGHFFIRYKDMVHFDQPAVLGNLIILLSIANFKKNKKLLPLLLASIIVPLWGRGYSSIFLLLTWNIIEFIFLYKSDSSSFFKKIIIQLKSKAFLCLLCSVPVTAGFLAYNVYIEAKVRNVSITETSIFDSAKRRLGVKTLVSAREKKAEFKRFIPKQIDRKKDLFTPELFSMFDIGRKKVSKGIEYYVRRLPAEIFGFLVFVFFFMNLKKYYKELDQNKKIIYLTSIFSGFVWLYTMRKLATYHDYTTLYYAGFSLMIYTTLIHTKFKNISREKLFTISLIIFLGSLVANLYKIYPQMMDVNHQAMDFTKIHRELEKMDNPIVHFTNNNPFGGQRFIFGSPFAHNFFTTGFKVGSTKDVSNVFVHWNDHKIEMVSPSE